MLLRYSILLLAGALSVTACGADDLDYADAVRRHWPSEQAKARDQAAFMADHAKRFEEGAAMASRIAASFGRENDVGVGHARAAAESRVSQESGEYLAASEFVAARGVSCASAAPSPGQNCEMSITTKGPDGRTHQLRGAWRFDEVDGRLSVVGGVER